MLDAACYETGYQHKIPPLIFSGNPDIMESTTCVWEKIVDGMIATFDDIVAEVKKLLADNGMTKPVRCIYRPDLPLEKTAESLIQWSITFGDALLQQPAEQRRVVLAHEIGHLRSRPLVVLALAGYAAICLEATLAVIHVDTTGYFAWATVSLVYMWLGQFAYEVFADWMASKRTSWRAIHDALVILPPSPIIGRGLRVRLARWLARRE